MEKTETYFWVERDTGHELEEYQCPGDEENVKKARRLWGIPNVHKNYAQYAYDICGSCK